MSEEEKRQGVSVHTGFPNPAADTSLRSLDLNKLLIVHGASTYFFRVRGNEWESIGVFDGDLAIVDRALDPRKPDVVIWWNDSPDEFRISTYKDMAKGATVWGIITSTIHQFHKTSIR
ncbi:MAG: S24 family peptidase [Patescibacteria group bacterium]